MSDSLQRYLAAGERAGSRFLLTPPRLAPAGLAGVQLGRRAGSSLEFMEYREYQPGDDLRHLDWGAFARSDRLILKRFQEEISPHVDVLIDGSSSMGLAGSEKAGAAAGVAALLATGAINAGYTLQAWLAAERCQPLPQGNRRPTAWQELRFTASRSPGEVFQSGPPPWRPHGIRIVISDLLWLGDPSSFLSRLAVAASGLIVLQVLARADVTPPEPGMHRLVDSETGSEHEVYLDRLAIKRYRERLARHRQAWERACRQSGATFASAIAEDLVLNWDLPELVRAGALRVV